jgi:hypothetical protein
MEKLRKDLNKELLKSKQVEGKLEDLAKHLRNKEDSIIKSKPIDFNTVN